MNERMSATDLVKNTMNPSTEGWYRRLSSEDQNYINDVVNELIANPNAHPYSVAEQVIGELSISRHPSTVARTLIGMKKHAQAKREKASR